MVFILKCGSMKVFNNKFNMENKVQTIKKANSGVVVSTVDKEGNKWLGSAKSGLIKFDGELQFS